MRHPSLCWLLYRVLLLRLLLQQQVLLLLRRLLLDDTHTSSITVQNSLRHADTAVDVADNDAVMPRRQEEYGLNILACK